MARTLDVADNRARHQNQTVIPTEVVRDFYVTNAPSLAALKLFHLMIATAGGRMADDTRHEIRLAAIRAIDGMKNHDRASLAPLFEELAAVVIRQGDPSDDAQVVTVGGLLDIAELAAPNAQGDALVWWYFGRLFRMIAGRSNHWAILDRQAIFHMQSKYSVLLFQHIASYAEYDHIHSKDFTVAQLRALLGIPAGKIARFSSLTRDILEPTIAEINQLTRLDLSFTTTKTGRTVTQVTIHWQTKPDPQPVKRELDTSKIGRKARRDDTAETPAPPAFPASGSIAYVDPWPELKQKAGCNMDNAMIADRFRDWCASRGLALDARNIAETFTAFCAKVGRV